MLVTPPGGVWSRTAILDWLLANRADPMLVGFDFSFSAPFIGRGAHLPGDLDVFGRASLFQRLDATSTRYGEEVLAWVRPLPGASLSAERLAAGCRGRIAAAKIPRHWKVVDAFPMTVTGKVQKYRMREIAMLELGQAAAAAA